MHKISCRQIHEKDVLGPELGKDLKAKPADIIVPISHPSELLLLEYLCRIISRCPRLELFDQWVIAHQDASSVIAKKKCEKLTKQSTSSLPISPG